MIILYIYNKLTKKDVKYEVPNNHEKQAILARALGFPSDQLPTESFPEAFAEHVASWLNEQPGLQASVVDLQHKFDDPWDEMKHIRMLVKEKRNGV